MYKQFTSFELSECKNERQMRLNRYLPEPDPVQDHEKRGNIHNEPYERYIDCFYTSCHTHSETS